MVDNQKQSSRAYPPLPTTTILLGAMAVQSTRTRPGKGGRVGRWGRG